MRVDAVECILQLLVTHSPVLCRAPPFSGKSSLAQLCATKLMQNPQIPVISISFAHYTHHDDDSFQTFWDEYHHPPHSCDYYRLPHFRGIIFIDEAQNAFACHKFWASFLKATAPTAGALSPTRPTSFPCSVIAFATYGEQQRVGPLHSPASFNARVGLDVLRFTHDEYCELYQQFREKRQSQLQGREDAVFTECVQEAVREATALHPGLVRECLWKLLDHYKHSSPSQEEVVKFVATELPSLIHEANLRCFFNFYELHSDLQAELLNCLYTSPKGTAYQAPNDRVMQLVKFGILAPVPPTRGRGWEFDFASPLVRSYYLQASTVSRPTVSRPTTVPVSLRSLLMMGIPRINVGRVLQSIEGPDKERIWQMELYRAISSCLPPENQLSPDVGHFFSSAGYLDFYVNHVLCWGLEILVNGNRLGGHLKRFQEGGVYAEIPLHDWYVIDCRSRTLERAERVTDSHLCRVELNADNCVSLTFYDRGEPQVRRVNL
eukprot:gnl/Trimastix_PCT/170.p1 GENE.gnl/Trimastix_PCT/170~~gnl/Trimastix_PCT/170.p1  ORF type:complete len:520 (-),score=25.27 gnl/Trimastix_PCT/170:225-1700(-)